MNIHRALNPPEFEVVDQKEEDAPGMNKNRFGRPTVWKKRYPIPLEYYFATPFREVAALRALDHPNIIKPCGVSISSSGEGDHHLTLSLPPGCASLRDWFMDSKRCRTITKERLIPSIMYQIIRAVSHIHRRGIIHRDLKPDNIIVFANGGIPLVQVADFGSSIYTTQGEDLYYHDVMTLNYKAPEILLAYLHKPVCVVKYGFPVDLWSIGVTFHYLLTGRELFNASTDKDLIMLIGECLLTTLRYVRELIDEDAFDLLERLLTIEPEDRITAEDALSHPYFKKYIVRATERIFPFVPIPRGEGKVNKGKVWELVLEHGGSQTTAYLGQSLYYRSSFVKGDRLFACLALAFVLTDREDEFDTMKTGLSIALRDDVIMEVVKGLEFNLFP